MNIFSKREKELLIEDKIDYKNLLDLINHNIELKISEKIINIIDDYDYSIIDIDIDIDKLINDIKNNLIEKLFNEMIEKQS